MCLLLHNLLIECRDPWEADVNTDNVEDDNIMPQLIPIPANTLAAANQFRTQVQIILLNWFNDRQYHQLIVVCLPHAFKLTKFKYLLVYILHHLQRCEVLLNFRRGFAVVDQGSEDSLALIGLGHDLSASRCSGGFVGSPSGFFLQL